jgi:acetyltransferase
MRAAGSTAGVTIRLVRASDAARLQQFIRGLSPSSRYLRFLMAIQELSEDMLDRFVHPQPGREGVLVAISPAGHITGLTQYVADEAGDGCEVAIVVGDAWHRQGLGTELLAALMVVAQDNEIGHVHADVLADNHAMLALARKLGCAVRTDAKARYLTRISRPLHPRTAWEHGVMMRSEHVARRAVTGDLTCDL